MIPIQDWTPHAGHKPLNDNTLVQWQAAQHKGEGVLLIGHGTRDVAGTEQFFTLAGLLARQIAPTPVQGCLLELQSPTIAQGWQRLMGQGVRHVHAVPLLLFAAGHAKADIPQALAACQTSARYVSWDQTRPLSRCPELLDLIVRRIDQVLQTERLDPQRTAIVLVGRGSHDVCAQTDMKLLAHCVGGKRSVRRIATAFYAMASPKLPTALQEVAADPTIDHIVVQPHILFEGAIHQGIRRLVSHQQDRDRDRRYWCTHYLGPEPELAAALVRRIAETHRQ